MAISSLGGSSSALSSALSSLSSGSSGSSTSSGSAQTATSASGAALQINGIVSGLDTSSIISALTAAESLPIKQNQARQTTLQTQQSAWMSLNAQLLALDTQAKALADPTTFQGRTAIVDQPSALKVTTQAGQDQGSYSLSVLALAQQNQQISSGYAGASDNLGTGTISIQMGNSTLAPITISDSQATLQGVSDAINAAGLGVSASVLDSGAASGASRYRLMLVSQNSGSAGNFTVNFNLSGGNAPTMSPLQAGQDAHIQLGKGSSAVDFYNSTNTFNNVLSGVSITAQALTTTPATLTIGASSDSIQNTVQQFITQYNGVQDFIHTQFQYNPTTQVAGTLFGNSALLNIQQELYSSVNSSRYISGSSLTSLASMGISTDSSGHLVVSDQKAYQAALQDPSSVSKFFSDSKNGVGTQLHDLIGQITNVASGVITQQNDALQKQYDALSVTIKETQSMVNAFTTSLENEFTAMETALSELRSQSAALGISLTSTSPSGSSSSSSSTGSATLPSFG